MTTATYDTPAGAAQSALRAFHDGAPISLPIDPVVIARDLGINVWHNAMENQLSGMLAKLSAEPTADIDMVVNQSHAPVRQRFTVAHELGHYFSVLRRYPQLETTFMFKRDDASSCGVYQDEIYANQFAAELLMPEDAVRMFWQSMDANSLAATFNVSPQAMNLRLKNLSLVP
jgi:Zn-dependent peptidase ImmA (M78 family)